MLFRPEVLRAALFGLGLASIWIAANLVFSPKSQPVQAASNPKSQSELPAITSKIFAIGSPNCAGQSCHGSASPSQLDSLPLSIDLRPNPERWKRSYLEWFDSDPHQKSFIALTSTVSQNIVKKWSKGKVVDATNEVACLACHANPSLARATDFASVSLRQEGVSCEACHGDSSAWRNEHFTWNHETNRSTVCSELGMNELNQVPIRADICTGCHVGASESERFPLRQVDHDMIAAGHPRLNFEMATFSRKLPQHWEEKDRSRGNQRRQANFESDVWLAGLVGKAKSEVMQLRDRSIQLQKNTDVIWPELTHFNCFSCHHDLAPVGWRKDPRFLSGRIAGSLPWNNPFTVFPRTVSNSAPVLANLLPEIEVIDNLLHMGRLPGIEPLESTLLSLHKLQQVIPGHGAETIQKLLVQYRDEPTLLQKLDWDGANIIFSAIVATFNSRKENAGRISVTIPNEGLLLSHLEQLHRILRLATAPERVNSPSSFGKSEFLGILKRTLEELLVPMPPSKLS
jgi:hypothetical protein